IICLRLECPSSREVCGLKCRQGEEDNAAITTTGGPDVVLGNASRFYSDRTDSRKPESYGLRGKSVIERFLPHTGPRITSTSELFFFRSKRTKATKAGKGLGGLGSGNMGGAQVPGSGEYLLISKTTLFLSHSSPLSLSLSLSPLPHSPGRKEVPRWLALG
ncbi:hypothetical protein ALC57_18099, partial [Trachymyrmex cornetzi]